MLILSALLLYVDAELEMFGSSANGFGSKDSDLDICLTLPGHDKVCTHHESPIPLVYTVRIIKSEQKYSEGRVAVLLR